MGSDQDHPWDVAEHSACDRRHARRRVDGPIELRTHRQKRDLPHRFGHLGHILVVLSAMGGDQHHRARRIDRVPTGRRRQIRPARRCQERVDDGIPRHDDVPRGNVFAQQVVARERGRRKVIAGDRPGQTPVHFFGVRQPRVARPQARFDVTNVNLPVKRRQRRRRAGRRIAVDEHDVGLRRCEYRLESGQHPGRDFGQRLVLGHDVEIEVRNDGKHRQQVVEHLAVLRGDADDVVDFGVLRERPHDGRHLDGVGTRPENRHNL